MDLTTIIGLIFGVMLGGGQLQLQGQADVGRGHAIDGQEQALAQERICQGLGVLLQGHQALAAGLGRHAREGLYDLADALPGRRERLPQAR